MRNKRNSTYEIQKRKFFSTHTIVQCCWIFLRSKKKRHTFILTYRMINCIYFPLSADQHTFPFNNLKLLSSLKGSFPKSKTVVPPFFFFFDLLSLISSPPFTLPLTTLPLLTNPRFLATLHCARVRTGRPRIGQSRPIDPWNTFEAAILVRESVEGKRRKEKRKEKKEGKKVSREFAIERSNRADNAASHLLADSQIRWRR